MTEKSLSEKRKELWEKLKDTTLLNSEVLCIKQWVGEYNEEILKAWFSENFAMELSEKNKEQDIECKIKNFLELLGKLKNE